MNTQRVNFAPGGQNLAKWANLANLAKFGKIWQIWPPDVPYPRNCIFGPGGPGKIAFFRKMANLAKFAIFWQNGDFTPPPVSLSTPPYRMVKLGFWGVPVRNPDSGIRNPGSGSGIRIRESGIRDPDGRGIGHGTKSWVATFGGRRREPKLNFGFPDSVSQLHGATRVRRSGHRGCVRVTSLAMYHAKKIRVTQLAEKIFRI